MILYVGNLPLATTERDLGEIFARFGPVTRILIMINAATELPRDFGFVTMANASDGAAAIQALHGVDFQGHTLTVNEPRTRDWRQANEPS